jgi:hypothetical protein
MQAAAPVSFPYRQGESQADDSGFRPLLELAISQTDVDSAYVYRWDAKTFNVTLLAFAGNPSVASANPKVPNTAEFRGGVYEEGVVSVPLMDNGRALGVANFCRAEKDPCKSRDVAFLFNPGVPLGALLTTSHLRAELQKTAQQLADRKLLDRAKGLLQERLGWSEEEAYLQVRRLSRQHRRPMREIARQIIEAGVQAFPSVRVQNAD